MVKNIYRLIKHKKMIKMKKNVEAGKTPAEISVSMIDQDLKDGVTKPEMAIKYGIKPWEVDEMFKHPFLKGRRPARKRTLSFSFVDDTVKEDTVEEASSMLYGVDNTDIETTVDPNQVTLEKAIDEAIEDVEKAKNQMQETQEAIVEMLSPTEFKTPEEILLEEVHETKEEEDLEIDEDTFEL